MPGDISKDAPNLPDRMRARADADSLPADHPLRVRADELDAADAENPRQLLGRWARARWAWSDYTGEELL